MAYRAFTQCHTVGCNPANFHSLVPPMDPSTSQAMGIATNSSSYSWKSEAFSKPNLSTTMAYGQHYGSDLRGQLQAFGGYGAEMRMHNAGQPRAPVYDTQRFAQHPQAPMRMTISDIKSNVQSAYLGGSGAGSAPTTALQHASRGPASSCGLYRQMNALIGCDGNIPGVNTMQESAASVEASDEPESHDTDFEKKWLGYPRQLERVFQNVKEGSLETAAEALLSLSDWLLTHVADLGIDTTFQRFVEFSRHC